MKRLSKYIHLKGCILTHTSHPSHDPLKCPTVPPAKILYTRLLYLALVITEHTAQLITVGRKISMQLTTILSYLPDSFHRIK